MFIISIGCEYNTLEEPVDCTISDLTVEVTAKQDANWEQRYEIAKKLYHPKNNSLFATL
jgi:hypothetical protein